MYIPPTGTKRALLEAAGELFAEYGLEGVGVRAIAEKAEANIAAVNYHFGSKENLYIEVLRYIVLSGQEVLLSEYVREVEKRTDGKDAYEVFRALFDGPLTSYLCDEGPEWQVKLLMRSLMEYSDSMKKLVEEVFRPDHEAVKQLISRLNPDLPESTTQLLSFALMGQMSFYVFLRTPVLMLLGRNDFGEDFILQVKETTARIMAAAVESFPTKKS